MTQDMKETIALNILTTRTLKEAAERSGCSVSTIKRLRRDEAFNQYLTELKRTIMEKTLEKAQAMTLDAICVLKEIMENEQCTDSSRVSAAKHIIDVGMESSIINELETRLNALNSELEAMKKEGG